MINQPDYNQDDAYNRMSDEGLCLLDGEIIVNPQEVAMIRRLDGKTLLYRSGVAEPDILPAKSFEQIREILFLPEDDAEDLDDLFDEDGEEDDSEEE